MNTRGFIPRARARGHARTLRARALYGMADPGSMYLTPGIPDLGQGPRSQGPGAPATVCYTRISPWARGPGAQIRGTRIRGLGPGSGVWAQTPRMGVPKPHSYITEFKPDNVI